MDIQNRRITIDVYIRPSQLVEPVDTKIRTLQQLEVEDIINTLSVHAWPDTVTLTEHTSYHEALDAFERMEAWADYHGLSIRPPFAIRTTTSAITGNTQTVLTTPILCLAIHADNRLANVFPIHRVRLSTL